MACLGTKMLRIIVNSIVRPSPNHCVLSRYGTWLGGSAETEVSVSSHFTKPHNDALIVSRDLEFVPLSDRRRRVWVENLDTVKEQKLGIIDLHPDVFACPPRLDVIQQNVHWQRMYRKVSFKQANSRAECRGGGAKPWPQKKMGKARHGSIRSPIWKRGGIAHGPRDPTSYFYMLSYDYRVLGLRSMLSVKLAQDDLHVVNSLDIPVNDPRYLDDLIEERLWGPSVLLIDDTDVAPENIALATNPIKHVNIMPVYGLNVYSMLKHDTLILTLAAVEKIEKQLLFNIHRTDRYKVNKKFHVNQH